MILFAAAVGKPIDERETTQTFDAGQRSVSSVPRLFRI